MVIKSTRQWFSLILVDLSKAIGRLNHSHYRNRFFIWNTSPMPPRKFSSCITFQSLLPMPFLHCITHRTQSSFPQVNHTPKDCIQFHNFLKLYKCWKLYFLSFFWICHLKYIHKIHSLPWLWVITHLAYLNLHLCFHSPPCLHPHLPPFSEKHLHYSCCSYQRRGFIMHSSVPLSLHSNSRN